MTEPGQPARVADWALTIRLVQLKLAARAAYLLLDDASPALTSVALRRLWVRRLFPEAIGLAPIAITWPMVLLACLAFGGPDGRPPTLEVAIQVALSVAICAVSASDGEPSRATVWPAWCGCRYGRDRRRRPAGLFNVIPSSHGGGPRQMTAAWSWVGSPR